MPPVPLSTLGPVDETPATAPPDAPPTKGIPLSALGPVAPKAAPPAQQTGGKKGIPLASLVKPVPEEKSFGSKALDFAAKVGSYEDPLAYWSNLKSNLNQYVEELKKDFTEPTEDEEDVPSVALAKQIKRGLGTLLDIGNVAFSPVTTGVDQTVAQTVKDTIGELGSLVQDHLDDQDLVLKRRYGPGGPSGKGTPAFDLTVHARDVANTVDALQQAVDAAINAGYFFVGPKGESAARASLEGTGKALETKAAAAERAKLLDDADRKLKPRVRIEMIDGVPHMVPVDVGPLEMREERDLQGFYSQTLSAIVSSPTKSASAAQWAATLKNAPGVKTEELEWIGVNDWLKEQKGPVTKEALAKFIQDHQVDMREIHLNEEDARYGEYVTPGEHDAYVESLFTKPPEPNAQNYREPHWGGTENVFAHSRQTTRTALDGEGTFHIEEIQSQLHQDARERGYIGEDPIQLKLIEKAEKLRPAALKSLGGADPTATPFLGLTVDSEKLLKNLEQTIIQGRPRQEAILVHARKVDTPLNNYLKALYEAHKKRAPPVPKLPFRQTQAWTELVFKRLLKEAIDQGYKRISWAHGEDQIHRYFNLTDEQKTGLMKHYDETVPAVAAKIGKKYGAKVKTLELDHSDGGDAWQAVDEAGTEIPGDGSKSNLFSNKYQYLEITPEMERAVRQGQPLFNQPLRLNTIRAVGEKLQRAGNAIRTAVQSGKAVNFHTLAAEVIQHLGADHPMSRALTRIMQAGAKVPVLGKGDGAFDSNRVHAYFQPTRQGGFIVLRKNGPGTDLQLIHDLVHEGVHAVTWAALRTDPVLLEHMKGLLELARKAIGEGAHYGLTSVDEFVAEAFSNQHFRSILATVKLGPRTVWEHFKDIIARLMNWPKEETTLLDEIMKQQDRLYKGSEHNKNVKAEDWRRELNERPEEEKPRVRIVGQDTSGKPRVRMATPEEASAATREALKADQEILDKLPENPKWLEAESVARRLGKGAANLWLQGVRMVSPGSLSKAARQAEAIIAKAVSQQMHESSVIWEKSVERRADWNRRLEDAFGFITGLEKGKGFKDPWLNATAEFYRGWSKAVFDNDRAMGHKFEPVDHYIYHLFQDPEKVDEFLTQKHGIRWADPSFTKERTFDLYTQALDEGFKPRYTNPEDIMLARQHASSVANMQINILRDLQANGLAVPKRGKAPPPFPAVLRRAPNGVNYWVHKDVAQILHNAFDSKSLWADRTAAGTAFRAGMEIKNTLVPIRLLVSLFHPFQGAISGAENPLKALGQMLNSGLIHKSLWENPRAGGRIRAIWQGRATAVSEADRQALSLIVEGGFIPEMSEQYRTKAITNLQTALQQRRSLKAAWQLPGAVLQAMQKPLFEWWIPNLKVASYLNDARLLLKANPELATDALKRQVLLRNLAKSVDNRYGEMSYNTLFWTRWVKDLAVMNTLSLGWNLGFLREFGGGAMDVGQFATEAARTGKITSQIKEGQLWKPIYATLYLSTAAGIGGLITYALTGKPPQDFLDYIYPRTGETNPDGGPARVNTMFYTREFAAVYKHMQQEGVVSGLAESVAAKGSGVMGLVKDLWTGHDIYGKEFRDPQGSWWDKLEQSVKYSMGAAEPMSLESVKGPVGLNKETGLALAGLTKAPRYATETATQSRIAEAYRTYVQPQQTAFEAAESSKEMSQLRQLYNADSPEFSKAFDDFTEKFDLSGDDVRRVTKSLSSNVPAEEKMFQRLPWPIQKRLLDQMSDEERDEYIPKSNKKHLRDNYEPPK